MIGSLDDLVRLGLGSAPTLRAWLRELPEDTEWLKKRGSKGDAYEIDLDEAVLAWRVREEEQREVDRRRSEEINQLRLELGGREGQSVGLSLAERKQLLEEEFLADKLARQRGELVPRGSAAAAFGDVLVKFRQRSGTFAARLAKKIDLSRAQITAIEAMVREDQVEFARLMEQMDLGEQRADGSHPAAAVEDPALLDGG